MFGLFKRKLRRVASIERKTKETQINCSFNIDGKGKTEISTGIGLLDHMLELFVFHGLFDLKLRVIKSDLNVDLHHTNEDVGIVMGQALKKALGDMQGISRFGFFSAPMEDVKADVTVDISGRGHFQGIRKTGIQIAPNKDKVKDNYSEELANHFFESFAKQSGINLIINAEVPATTSFVDIHTVLEPIFKALGKALDKATQIDPRRKGIPSTKGIID
ncbi:MAG: imidazoleglycerol-phosphate dehydratase [Candidatus Omnitrophota bacterium]|jgi:imidazoleglycerol-phosphate dehydratase